MQMPTPLTMLFAYPVAEILAALPVAEDPVWNAFGLRQKVYGVHGRTRWDLLLDRPGEIACLVLVVGTDDKELPPAGH